MFRWWFGPKDGLLRHVGHHPAFRVPPASEHDLVPPDSDETLLSCYMNQISSTFPFVIIPPDTAVEELQSTRPFLLNVIKMIASVRHWRSVHGQSYAVMQHISEAVLIRSERSLELLQGILCFLGYYHSHCLMHSQFNNLIQLSISMIADLGLNQSPVARERTRILVTNPPEVRSRTNEERRAIVGVWYMSSKYVDLLYPITRT